MSAMHAEAVGTTHGTLAFRAMAARGIGWGTAIDAFIAARKATGAAKVSFCLVS